MWETLHNEIQVQLNCVSLVAAQMARAAMISSDGSEEGSETFEMMTGRHTFYAPTTGFPVD